MTSQPDRVSTMIVTGANRGLGLEFAKQYAADGCGWRTFGDTTEGQRLRNGEGKSQRDYGRARLSVERACGAQVSTFAIRSRLRSR